MKTFVCSVCGYKYDEAEEGEKFSKLAEDWVCPLCGVSKEDFDEE